MLRAAWLVALPSILAGVLDVLAPLRMDELGATGVAVGAVFLVAAAVEGVISPSIGRFSDRRGRMMPIRIGLIACPLAALAAPLPESWLGIGAMVLVVVLAMSLIWTPAMTLLSEDAETAGLDLAFATALVSLAWAGGQVIGGSAGASLADATSDGLAYALVAALFAVTLVAGVFVAGQRDRPWGRQSLSRRLGHAAGEIDVGAPGGLCGQVRCGRDLSSRRDRRW